MIRTGSTGWTRYGATAAAMTMVMAAAACSSSGVIGVTTSLNLDLNTVSATQALKDAIQGGIARQSVRIHSVVTQPNGLFTQDGPQRTDRFQQDLTTATTDAGKHIQSETRGDGNSVYMDDPTIPAADRHGKTWVKLDLGHPPSASSTDPTLAALGQLATLYQHADPQQGALVNLAIPDLHRVGVETKDGRQALHIAGTVTADTLPKVPPAGSGLTQDYLDYYRQRMQTLDITKSSIDIWIGADGLEIEYIGTQSASGGDTVSDSTLSQWGVPVSVVAPPAEDTYVVPGGDQHA